MTLEEKYNLVRKALVGVVDCDDPDQLNRIKNMMQHIEPTDDFQKESKQKGIDAIEALLMTQPNNEG